jgi:hypothetical protein
LLRLLLVEKPGYFLLQGRPYSGIRPLDIIYESRL